MIGLVRSSRYRLIAIIFISVYIICGNSLENEGSYARVLNAGAGGSSEGRSSDGPKIFKSLHMDLNVATTTPSSEKVFNETGVSSGRAYMDAGSFRTSNFGSTRLRPYKVSRPSYMYPVYRPSYKRVDQAMDRFTPGEAVATQLFKERAQGYKYPRPPARPPAPPPPPPPAKPMRPGGNYIPPKDLYSFPPNIGSSYSSPSRPDTPRKPITSYIPPPAGPPDTISSSYIPSRPSPPKSISSYIPTLDGPPLDKPPSFVGPVNPEYLPPFSSDSQPESGEMGKNSKPDGDKKMEMPTESSAGSDMLPPFDSGDNKPPDDDGMPPPGKDMDDSGGQMDSPPMDDDSSSQDMMPGDDKLPPFDGQFVGGDDHDHDHDHFELPDDHSHHHPYHHHHHGPSTFYGSHGVDAYPEIVWDSDHDHHDHHDHHHHHHTEPPPPPPEMTTEKPEPPPEPRVKKYSYFYLGRKLWYIPLYFTVWFSFYILWLIIKSIARHKVNLPNHYTGGGRMMRRALTDELTHSEIIDKVNDLTVTVMDSIDNFERKYSTT